MSSRQSGGTWAGAFAVVVAVAGAAFFVLKAADLLPGGAKPAGAADAAAPAPSASPAPAAQPPAPTEGSPAAGSSVADDADDTGDEPAPRAAAPSNRPAIEPAPKSGGSLLGKLGKALLGESELSQAAKWRHLATTVQTMRAQIHLYRLQHRDEFPDFRRYPRWEQLSQKTYEDGTPADQPLPGRQGDRRYGPYVQSAPANPLNGAAEVAVVDGDVSPGDAVTPPAGSEMAGYVFSPTAGILWATDATGLRVADVEGEVARLPKPPPRAASKPRPEDHLSITQSTAQMIRSQVALYRLMHEDTLPDFRRYPNWEQLTSKTTVAGVPSAKGNNGPYFQKVPVNLLTNSSRVDVVEGQPAADYRPPAGTGWVYDAASGVVWPVGRDGIVILQW